MKRAQWLKHGMSQSSEWKSWRSMMRRCFEEKVPEYPRYGGRGITACESLRDSFQFLAYMGPKPAPKYTLERIDNNLHYSCGVCEECKTKGWPMNCKWATHKEQNNNKRSNRFLTHNGKTLTMSEWADLLHMSKEKLHQRLKRNWPIAKALDTL